MFGACCDERALIVKLDAEVKRTADALSAVRDADVMVGFLTTSCQTLPEDQSAGVRELIVSILAQRKAYQQSVVHVVDRMLRKDLLTELTIITGYSPVMEEPAECLAPAATELASAEPKV